MDKQICECYRSGAIPYRVHRARLKYKLRSAVLLDDFDGLVPRESIRSWANLNWSRKEFGENLSPLRRFILSSIGRPWNDIHSEMSRHIRLDSTVQRHIWEHVQWYIEEHTLLDENGEVRYYPNRGWDDLGPPPKIEESFALVYVCPETGVLKKVPRARYRYRSSFVPYKKVRVEIDKWTQAHNLKGNWYLLYLDPIPKAYWKPWTDREKKRCERKINEYVALGESGRLGDSASQYCRNAEGRWVIPKYRDCAIDDIIDEWDRFLHTGGYDPDLNEQVYGRIGVYAIRRKQMNKREIRRYKVREHMAIR